MDTKREGIALTLSGVALTFCVLMTGGRMWMSGAALARNGVRTDARVLEFRHRNRGARIRYGYVVRGHAYQGVDRIRRNSSGYGKMTIPIVYLPNRPGLSHFDPADLEARGRAVTLVGLPLAGCFLGFGMWKLRRAAQVR